MEIVQFSFDCYNKDDLDSEKICEILEKSGLEVMGVQWKAIWTEDDYLHGRDPYSWD